MRNLKVMMAYRGTNYHGFQRQKNAITVQEVVEKHVSSVLNEDVEIFGCSRTDTGVHANQYCFSVMTNSNIPTGNFIRGVNGKLPQDIAILSCEEASLDFHARYSCKAKEYIYKIHNRQTKNPFTTDLEYHYRRPLDVELMRKAAQYFVGTHDFKSFCSIDSDKINTIRTIHKFELEISGDSIIMLVKGDGFLYNMIRIMVGTLIWVDEGKINIDELSDIIKAKDRNYAGKTAQAHGLYLNKIYYDEV
ncbi:MAG TPA: tRNA pseudouridine(38-40) synthase TruA [Clostridiales bacterium]|nr:tRNA pseudouridine(38-40) synthase TruA [Clostridiales bacterium]